MCVCVCVEFGHLHLQAEHEDVGHRVHGQRGRVEHPAGNLVPQAEAQRDHRHGNQQPRCQNRLGRRHIANALETGAQESR